MSEKRPEPAPAKDLYTSIWFKKARRYVEGTGRPWFILSAEHGLVSPDQVLAPYEKTLNTMPIAQRRSWAAGVARQLKELSPPIEHAVFLAGLRYREFLGDVLKCHDVVVDVPMEGLKIGEQLSWLGSHGG